MAGAAGTPKRMKRSHLRQIEALRASSFGSWVGMDSGSRGLFCFGVIGRTGPVLAGQETHG